MNAFCVDCCNEIRPGARYCGHCGSGVHAITPVHSHSIHEVVAPPVVQAPLAHHQADELAARMQLEVMTRLNPLMNHERMKAMGMAIAAHGGTGTVGFWSDD